MGKHLPKDIKALARAHTDSALRVLTGIMTNEKVSPAARVTAALGVLDRGWGKAAQSIEMTAEIATKVIRAPTIAKSPESWADLHVPPHLKQEVLN